MTTKTEGAMKVEVIPTYKEDAPHVYEEASGWHIDPERQLHITKNGGGNIGSYATGCWTSVRQIS